jgi:ElaA protein
MKIIWKIKSFDELSTTELYNILKLRMEVFVVEQNCPYQDADGKDLKSYHLMGLDESSELIAYSRIVPAGISFAEVSIGRVVSSPKLRGSGAGKALMQKSIEEIYQKYGAVPIHIGAQLYLKKFYESFGFVQISEEYLEDNIPHMEMIKK